MKENLAQKAAAILREGIMEGALPPSTPLREKSWAERLEISRNTLREAFRILAAQGLIDHRVHHGATVRALTLVELREIYAMRATMELRGVHCSAYADSDDIISLVDAANRLQRAALSEKWAEVGTLSLAVHRRFVHFIGSPRLDDLFATVAAQARLAFSQARDIRTFQSPWVMRDVEICTLICEGNRVEAARALKIYLIESEQSVLEAMRARSVPRPGVIFDFDEAG